MADNMIDVACVDFICNLSVSMSLIVAFEVLALLVKELYFLFCFVFQIGHVTKSGEIAGPRVLEHIVDVVLYMEVGTSLHHSFFGLSLLGRAAHRYRFNFWACLSIFLGHYCSVLSVKHYILAGLNMNIFPRGMYLEFRILLNQNNFLKRVGEQSLAGIIL